MRQQNLFRSIHIRVDETEAERKGWARLQYTVHPVWACATTPPLPPTARQPPPTVRQHQDGICRDTDTSTLTQPFVTHSCTSQLNPPTHQTVQLPSPRLGIASAARQSAPTPRSNPLLEARLASAAKGDRAGALLLVETCCTPKHPQPSRPACQPTTVDRDGLDGVR